MNSQPDERIHAEPHRIGGKYLTFVLGQAQFGVEIQRVREILDGPEIMAAPGDAACVTGMVEFRGKPIPVVDLQRRLGLPPVPAANRPSIIVVGVGQADTGIIVDKVAELLNIPSGDVAAPPACGASIHTDFVLGVTRVNNTPTILLDIARVLAGMDAQIRELEAGTLAGR